MAAITDKYCRFVALFMPFAGYEMNKNALIRPRCRIKNVTLLGLAREPATVTALVQERDAWGAWLRENLVQGTILDIDCRGGFPRRGATRDLRKPRAQAVH